MGVAAIIIHRSGADLSGPWARVLQAIARRGAATQELFLFPLDAYRQPQFLQATADAAVRSLVISSITLIAAGALLFVSRYRPRLGYLLAGVAAVEIFVFAQSTLSTTNVERPYPDQWKKAVQMSPPDSRVLHADLGMTDWAMTRGLYEIWGYDPGVLRRYAELMYLVYGLDPDRARQYLPSWTQMRPTYGIVSMLRWHLILIPNERPKALLPEPLPQVTVVPNYRVLTSRNEIFAAMDSPLFNPRQQVILEEEPEPVPSTTGTGGEAKIVQETTDTLEIKADLPQPAILLVTDNYSRGWRVRSLEPGTQAHYRVMPADYVLRASPLASGKHHFVLEYAPAGFVVGKWITGFSLLAYLGLWLWLRRRDQPSG